jgi:hypothetical protein
VKTGKNEKSKIYISLKTGNHVAEIEFREKGHRFTGSGVGCKKSACPDCRRMQRHILPGSQACDGQGFGRPLNANFLEMLRLRVCMTPGIRKQAYAQCRVIRLHTNAILKAHI